jgi:hypothetical protein
MRLKRIAVFCGSSFGKDGIYEKQAFEAEILAERKIGLLWRQCRINECPGKRIVKQEDMSQVFCRYL